MMNKTNQSLSQVLDIEPIEFETTEVIQKEESKIDQSIEDDSEFARSNIRELIEKGNIAMDNLLHVAKESEHPRAYEVAATLLKNLSDLNKDLMEIQKRKKDLYPAEFKSKQNINVDKAVFVGSTTELVKFLKNKQNDGN